MPSDFTELVDWILTGEETFTYKTLTSPTITGPTFSGTTTFSGPVNVGEDDTGYDVKLFGATGSNYVLWDESEDLLSVVQTNASTSGTERAATVTLTQTGAGAISEAFYAKVIANVQTGSWVNGIVGRVDYSTGSTGDAGGGMAAAICAELNLPAKSPSGGSYYCMDLELEAPENYESITSSTTFPVAFQRMALWGNATATDDWQDYGYIFHIADLDDATGNVFYDNTLRILANTTAWYIPLSDAEGEYSSAYLIDISNATDASSTTAASIATDGGIACAKQLYLGDDLDMSTSATGTYDITLKTSVADALSITDGTDIIVINTSTRGVTITPDLTITGNVICDDATDASSTTTGSIQTDGGLGVVKAIVAGGNITVGGGTLNSDAGEALTVSATAPSSTNDGVDLNLTGSAGNTTGAGGDVDIDAGAGAGTDKGGGNVELTAGAAGTGNAAGGKIDIDAGLGAGTGNGGAVELTSGVGGAGVQGDGGAISLTAGAGGADGDGGAVSITAGDAGGGDEDGGTITIATGNANGSGTDGDLDIKAREVTVKDQAGTGTAIVDLDVASLAIDGGLTNIGGGSYSYADGDNDLGVDGDIEASNFYDAEDGGATLVSDGGDSLGVVNSIGHINKTVVTFTNFDTTTTDAAGNGGHGYVLLAELPEGVIKFIGSTIDVALTAAAGISATATYDVGLGTTQVGTDNQELATTEQNILTKVEGDLSSSEATIQSYLGTDVIVDGHATNCDIFLNIAIEADDSDSDSEININGSATIYWVNLGDY